MRILNFSDGFATGDNPQTGIIKATNLHALADNDAFIAVKGASASAGDIYFNTTSNKVRFYNGGEWLEALEQDLDGNVTISNDLIVNGTTVTINTANLNVEDKNITVNNNGSDATADGAGLAVDRDGALGSLVFDSSKASMWKAGLQGSEKELVDVSSTQTVTNKSINASDNTISNISNSSISSSAGIEFSKLETLIPEKMVVSNPSGVLTTIGVSSIKAGYLSDVTSNIQAQIDNKASTTDLTTHESDTSTHGISGNVVGTTDTQALTNKDIDGGTASNSNRITLPKNTKSNLDALTRKEGTIVYDTTSKKSYLDNGTALIPVGSGSGNINFLSNPDGSLGTSGWIEGVYTAASRPSGSFTAYSSGSFSVTTTSTNPLGNGSSSILLTKASGSSKQGCAVETSFALPLSYRAKVLQIEIDYIVNSGTFVAGSNSTDSSMIWYCAFSSDNGSTYTVSEPSSFKLLSNSTTISDKFRASIQTPSNATNMKLIAYVAETATAAWEVKAVCSVSPSTYVYGSPITDWQIISGGIAITDSAGTNVKSASPVTNTASWRRVGSNLELKFSYYHSATAGSLGATGAYRFYLPTGLTVDSRPEVAGGGGNSASGFGMVGGDIGGGYWATFKPYSAQTFNYFELQVTEEQNTVRTIVGSGTGGGFNSIFAFNQANVGLSGVVTFPIQGWSASVQMSDQSDTRIVNLVAQNSVASQALTNGVTNINYLTTVKDTHGGWNGSQYTVQVPGDYSISACAYSTSTSSSTQLFVNGTQFGYLGTNGTNVAGSGTIIYPNAKVGDVISLRGTSFTVAPDSAQKISITRISGPSAIAATELISLTYRNSSGQSIAHNTITTLTNWTKLHDSHGCFNATTGIFTAPASGTYNFSYGITFGDTVAANDRLVRLKDVTNNSDVIDNYRPYNAGGSGITMQTTTIDLVVTAGQQFRIEVYQGSGSSQPISPAAQRNYISIKRVGN